ncbi:MAG TPA: hypothetical protein VD713_05490, partial [Sphingomonadales bacterium]|nr:hypothetical protein [Sphingomonadales bacterium]
LFMGFSFRYNPPRASHANGFCVVGRETVSLQRSKQQSNPREATEMLNKLYLTLSASAIALLALSGCEKPAEEPVVEEVVEETTDDAGTMEQAGEQLDQALEDAGEAVEDMVEGS